MHEIIKEIRLTLQHHGYLRFGSCDSDIDQLIAARLKPLVEDAERLKMVSEIAVPLMARKRGDA